MWRHHLIEDLRELMRNISWENSHLLEEVIDEIASDEVISVYAGDISTFCDLMAPYCGKEANLLETKFPFFKTLFTYSVIDSENSLSAGQTAATKRAVFVDATASDLAIFVSFHYADSAKRWVVDPVCSIISRTEPGKMSWDTGLVPQWILEGHDPQTLQAEHGTEVTATLAIMDVMSCKNVGMELVAAPAALNKKRLKKNKTPVFAYRTLVVDLRGSRTVRPGAQADSPGSATQPLHIRFGHYKTYTEERPLFGKHVGRYWWQPVTKGDLAHGKVVKRYKLKV